MSYYVIKNGQKYDRELLELAREFAKDGQISFAEAHQLWEEALDGPGVTPIEKQTLQHITEELRFTEKALKFLQDKVQSIGAFKKKGTSYYKQIKGIKYDRSLLDMAQSAEKEAQDGIGRTSAAKLVASAKDGPGITQCEQRTLEYILKNYKLSDDAKSLLRNFVSPKAKNPSYYVQINNVSYDREVIELSDKHAGDGEINLAEAKELWDKVMDGPGVTECEKLTIEYILKTHKCTPEARSYLHKMLLGTHVLQDAGTKPAEGHPEMKALAPLPPVQTEDDAAAKAAAEKEVQERNRRARARALEKEERRLQECEKTYGEIFDKIDGDGNGFMTKEELEHYAKTEDEHTLVDLGIGNWQEFLKEIDLDGDGKVQRDEFIAFFSFGDAELDPDRLFGALFDAIDVSQDGILQPQEILDYQWYRNPQMMYLLGVEDFSQLALKMDEDGNGKVDRDEFISYLKGAVGQGTEEVAAWKKMLQAGRTATKEFGSGFGAAKPGRDSCWDFAKGYCGRGAQCKWKHDAVLDHAGLSERRKRNAKQAFEEGINITREAHSQLQSLSEEEAEALLRSVAPGGQHANVHAKSAFICHEVRRRHAKAAGTWGIKRQRTA